MTEEEKKIVTRENYPGRDAQGHKLAALMKKRKEEMRNKEQSTEQSTVQPSVQPSVQSSVQSAVQSAVQSNYVYGVGILAVLAICVCIFFAYNASQAKNKKLVNEKQNQPPKPRHLL